MSYVRSLDKKQTDQAFQYMAGRIGRDSNGFLIGERIQHEGVTCFLYEVDTKGGKPVSLSLLDMKGRRIVSGVDLGLASKKTAAVTAAARAAAPNIYRVRVARLIRKADEGGAGRGMDEAAKKKFEAIIQYTRADAMGDLMAGLLEDVRDAAKSADAKKALADLESKFKRIMSAVNEHIQSLKGAAESAQRDLARAASRHASGPSVTLGRDTGTDMSEADFDSWVHFVTLNIDERAGYEVGVDVRGRRDIQDDDYVGKDEEEREFLQAIVQDLWAEWCEGPRSASVGRRQARLVRSRIPAAASGRVLRNRSK